MRNVSWWLCLVVAVASLNLAGSLPAVLAAEDDDKEQRGQVMPPRGPMERDRAAMMCPAPSPMCRHAHCVLKCLLSVLIVVHVLLAVWVFTDIRKRGEGHGIFIVLALLAGLPAAILYALVRIGDKDRKA